MEFVGFIEGIAEGISNGLRWLGGLLSDMAQRRKPFVFWGYLFSALSKPIMGLAVIGGWGVFLIGRSADRFGKSVRSAARDALIADSTDKQYRGVAFGFHSAMDTCGAIIGPLMAIAILLFWPHLSIAWLFLVALVPSLAATVVVLFSVRDIPHTAVTAGSTQTTCILAALSGKFLAAFGGLCDIFAGQFERYISYPTFHRSGLSRWSGSSYKSYIRLCHFRDVQCCLCGCRNTFW